MLEALQTMWDGHLQNVNVAKHRVALQSSNQRPSHSTPYGAGPKARDPEKQDV